MRRVIVCGGKDYKNRDLVYQMLDAANAYCPIDTVICATEEEMSEFLIDWCDDRGVMHETLEIDLRKGWIKRYELVGEAVRCSGAVLEFVGEYDNLSMPVISEAFDHNVPVMQPIRRIDWKPIVITHPFSEEGILAYHKGGGGNGWYGEIPTEHRLGKMHTTYRMKRGVMKHLLPKLRRLFDEYPDNPYTRNPLGTADQFKKTRGRCVWCETWCNPRGWWHKECFVAYSAAIAQPCFEMNKTVPEFCLCGKNLSSTSAELDHVMAIGTAFKLGLRFALQAFFVENLRWICSDCHRVKTRFDRAVMSDIDKLKKDPDAYAEPEPLPQLPLFGKVAE